MDYKGTLIAVKNMEKAKQFYRSLLGLEVVMDAGANVQLTGGVFLQTADTWVTFIRKAEKEIIYANNAIELYFETDDMDDFQNRLSNFADIVYLHPLLEHSWGQRAVRFYDLDGHIIEVAENIAMVVKKFIASGLSINETAKRMDVDTNYIKSCLEQ
jgi:catechol 2,3-dioxygenase-like lactoylglutathione lyase family enzyme